jgi:hypothetical protein
MTLGLGRKPLRKDPRGWQIEDDASAEACLQALEAAGLVFLEVFLKRLSRLPFEPDTALALRGLGHTAGAHGMTRLTWSTGVDETGQRRADRAGTPEAEAFGEAMRRVLNWLLIWDPTNPDAPPEVRPPSPPPAAVILDLDELHAAAVALNRRASSQGTRGRGSRRNMTRTTTRRRT